MRLFGKPSGAISSDYRGAWVTPPFDADLFAPAPPVSAGATTGGAGDSHLYSGLYRQVELRRRRDQRLRLLREDDEAILMLLGDET